MHPRRSHYVSVPHCPRPGSSAQVLALAEQEHLAESREFQSVARRPVVSTKLKSLLLFCRARTVPSPSRLPSLLLHAWVVSGQTDERVPSSGWSPAAVTVQAESQCFGNLRFVVTSHFLNLLHVNWILQWEIPQGLCGAQLGSCECRTADLWLQCSWQHFLGFS